MKIQAEDFLANMKLKHNAYYPAAVAGGALRDIVLNKEVKDVDLFIRPPAHHGMNLMEAVAQLWMNTDTCHIHGVFTSTSLVPVKDTWVPFELIKQGEGESGCGEDFSSYLCPDIPGLNVIVLGQSVRTVHGVTNDDALVKYLFNHFPCNMSRIALNENGLYVDDSFWEGVIKKQFVYDMSKIKNNYMERMMEKYPAPWKHDSEFTIVTSTSPSSLWGVGYTAPPKIIHP
jgi:hypothetical protein